MSICDKYLHFEDCFILGINFFYYRYTTEACQSVTL